MKSKTELHLIDESISDNRDELIAYATERKENNDDYINIITTLKPVDATMI